LPPLALQWAERSNRVFTVRMPAYLIFINYTTAEY